MLVNELENCLVKRSGFLAEDIFNNLDADYAERNRKKHSDAMPRKPFAP